MASPYLKNLSRVTPGMNNVEEQRKQKDAVFSLTTPEVYQASQNYAKNAMTEMLLNHDNGEVLSAAENETFATIISNYWGLDKNLVKSDLPGFIEKYTGIKVGANWLQELGEYASTWEDNKRLSYYQFVMNMLDPESDAYKKYEQMSNNVVLSMSKKQKTFNNYGKIGTSIIEAAPTAMQLIDQLILTAGTAGMGAVAGGAMGAGGLVYTGQSALAGAGKTALAKTLKGTLAVGASGAGTMLAGSTGAATTAGALTGAAVGQQLNLFHMDVVEAGGKAYEMRQMYKEDGTPMFTNEQIKIASTVYAAGIHLIEGYTDKLVDPIVKGMGLGKLSEPLKKFFEQNFITRLVGYGWDTLGQSAQEGIEGLWSSIVTDTSKDLVKLLNREKVNVNADRVKEVWKNAANSAWEDFSQSLVGFGVGGIPTAILSGMTGLNRIYFNPTQVNSQMSSDAKKYFTGGRPVDIRGIDTMGDTWSKESEESIADHQHHAIPVAYNEQTGLLVPVNASDRALVATLRESGATGVGVIFVDAKVNESVAQYHAAVIDDAGDYVYGTSGNTILVKDEQGLKYVDEYFRSNSNTTAITQSDDGTTTYYVKSGNRSEGIKVKIGTQEMEEKPESVEPVKTYKDWASLQSERMSDNDPYSVDNYLRTEDERRAYEAINKALPESEKMSFNQRRELQFSKLGAARIMPIVSEITGMNTSDVLDKFVFTFDTTGKLKEANAYGGFEKIDGKLNVKIRIDKAVRPDTIMHEVIHGLRSLATSEQLAGFAEAYGGAVGGMWVEDIKKTADGWTFGDKTYKTHDEALEAASKYEERFVDDFMRYLYGETGFNDAQKSFFAKVKQFFEAFWSDMRSILKDKLDAKTVKAFDILFGKDTDAQERADFVEVAATEGIKVATELASTALEDITEETTSTLLQGGSKRKKSLENLATRDAVDISEDPTTADNDEETYRAIKEATNKESGNTVEFVNSAFGKIKGHNNYDPRLIGSLKSLFEEAVFLGTEGPDFETPRKDGTKHKISNNIESYSYYLNKVVIDGNPALIRYTVQNLKHKEWKNQRHEFHSQQLTNIEISDASNVSTLALWAEEVAASDSRLADLLRKINSETSNGMLHQRIMDRNTQARIDADYEAVENALRADASNFDSEGNHLAPNGEKSNLTYKQWVQVRTPAFMDWFGDWLNDPENASKIVDENGEPKVVFHGATAKFDTFAKRSDIGFHFGTELQAEEVLFIHSSEMGFNEEEAQMLETFLNIRNPITGITDPGSWTGDNLTMAQELLSKGYISDVAYKGLERMFMLDDLYNRVGDPTRMNDVLRKELISKGYDGIIYTNLFEGAHWENGVEVHDESYMVFNPNQIKSATDNVGTFDSENNSILYQSIDSAVENAERIVASETEYKATWKADGSLVVAGDKDTIRSKLPEEIKGTYSKKTGTYTFKPSMAKTAYAALTGESSFVSRSGSVSTRYAYDSNGKIVGAPAMYDTAERITRLLRPLLSQLAKEGEAGKNWYEHSSRAILKAVGGDLAEAEKFAAVLAILSPQMKVDANTTIAVKAWMQYKAGVPISVKTAVQNKQLNDLLYNNISWDGQKTNNFYINLLREISRGAEGQGVTVDMWMMRAFGYDNDNPTDAQYYFIENETNKIAKKLGWEPQQVQAAIWVALKARTEDKEVKAETERISQEKGYMKYVENEDGKKVRVILDPANHRKTWLKVALSKDISQINSDQAKFDFADGLERNIGQISVEAAPSRTSGILEGYFTASPELRAQFFKEVFDVFLDSEGNDELNRLCGLLTLGSVEAPGVWEGDVSLGLQQLVAIPTTEIDGQKTVTPEAGLALEMKCALLGFFLHQDGVAWNKALKAKNNSNANGIDLNIKRVLTNEEALSLSDVINEVGAGKLTANDVIMVSNPHGMYLANGTVWGDHPIDNKEFCDIIRTSLEQWKADVEYNDYPYHHESNLIENNWKEQPNGEGYTSWFRRNNRLDVLRTAIDRYGENLGRILRRYSQEYGWGNPGNSFSEALSASEQVTSEESTESTTLLQLIKDSNKSVESLATDEKDIVRIDGLSYIKDDKAYDYDPDTIRNLKDSVSEELHTFEQLEFDFADQTTDSENGEEQGKSGEVWTDNGERASLRPIGLRPSIAQYFHFNTGWNGEEPSIAIDNQWDNFGYVSFIGTEVYNSEDVAKLFSLYRNPRFEYFHIAFVRDGKIVGHTALSSGLPGRTFATPEGGHNIVLQRMQALNADGYYLVHNHPSGNVAPSNADIQLTYWYSKDVPGFLGHVILDHDKYHVLSGVETSPDGTRFGFRENEARNTWGFHEIPNVGEGKDLSYSGAIASYVFNKMNNDSATWALYIDNAFRPLELEPVSAIPNEEDIFNALKTKRVTRVVYVTTDKEYFSKVYYQYLNNSASDSSYITDFILINPKDSTKYSSILDTAVTNTIKFGKDWQDEVVAEMGEGFRIPKWDKDDSSNTLFQLSDEERAEALKAREADIREATQSGRWIRTEYIAEFAGQDWADNELYVRNWMTENPALWSELKDKARDTKSYEDFKEKLSKEVDAEGENKWGVGSWSEEDEALYNRLYQIAQLSTPQERNSSFIANHVMGDRELVKMAKTLREYSDLGWIEDPNRGDYANVLANVNRMDGVSNKVLKLNDKSTSAEIAEARQSVLKDTSAYRNAFNKATNRFNELDALDENLEGELNSYSEEQMSLERKANLSAEQTDWKKTAEELEKKLADAEADLEKLNKDNLTLEQVEGRLAKAREELKAYKAENKALKERQSDLSDIAWRKITEKNEEIRELKKIINAFRRREEARAAREDRKKMFEQIKNTLKIGKTTFGWNSNACDAKYLDAFSFLRGLFAGQDRSELIERRHQLISAIDELKTQNAAQDLINNLEDELEDVRAEINGSEMKEVPAILRPFTNSLHLKADNRISKYTTEELSDLLTIAKALKEQAKRVFSERYQALQSERSQNVSDYFAEIFGQDISDMDRAEIREAIASMQNKEFMFNKLGLGLEMFRSWNGQIGRFSRHLDGKKEGVLYNFFTRVVRNLYEEEQRNIQYRLEAGEKKFSELGLKTTDLNKIMILHTEAGKKGYTFMKDNGEKVRLTVDQAIGVYIYGKNEDGLMKLRSASGNGITEEAYYEIIAHLTPEQKAWGDWMMAELESHWQDSADTLYNVYNMTLGKVENYFTFKSEKKLDGKDEGMDIVTGSSGDTVRWVNKGYTKERVRAIYPLDLHVSRTWANQVRKEEHFVAFAKWGRDANYYMDTDAGFGEVVEKKFGPNDKAVLAKYVKDVISPGGYTDEFDKVISTVIGRGASAMVAGNLSVMAKQIPTLAAAVGNVGIKEFFNAVIARDVNLDNFLKANQIMYEDYEGARKFINDNSPVMKGRKYGTELIDNTAGIGRGDLDNATAKLNSKIMRYTAGLTDSWVTSTLWLARYMTVFNQMKAEAKKNGTTFNIEEAHKEAVFKAGQLISETQNTSVPMDLSYAMRQAKYNPFMKPFYLFSSTTMNLFNQIFYDIPYYFKNKDYKGIAKVVTFVALNMVGMLAINGAFHKKKDEDDEEYAKRLAKEVVSQSITIGVPGFGGGIASAVKGWSGNNGEISLLSDTAPVVQKVFNPSKNKTGWENFVDIMGALGYAVAEFEGLPANAGKKLFKSAVNANPGYLINNTWGEIVEDLK